jgi:TolA-binding protein
MNLKVKLAAYAVLLSLAAWFGWGFYSSYYEVAADASVTVLAENSPGPVAAETSNSPPALDTNNPPETNASPATNLVATNALTNLADDATNAAVETSNSPALTAAPSNNVAAAGNSHPKKKKAKHHVVVRTAQQDRGTMIRYLAALVASLIGLGLLVALDTTHFIGSQATNYLFHDVADATRDPAYERAEAAWANGRFMEAIELMRGFLKENPREIYAALRIAEIYEKDLRNYLAAALEYEEVLKHKLQPERWGWAAVHLCNLYSKLGQQPKAAALLRRIVDEYPRTGAAKKARARLGMEELAEDAPEAQAEEEAPGEQGPYQIDGPDEPPPTAPPPSPKPTEPPNSNLPSGFSPKK